MNRRKQAGLTLIEVMIAIAVMGLLSYMSWRGLDSVTRASDRIDASTEATASILRSLRQIERDIALRATTELPTLGRVAASAAEGEEQAPAQFPNAILVERQTGIPLRIDIIRTAAGSPGNWQRIQWWRKDSTLYRAAGPVTGKYPMPAAPVGIAVLENIVDFDIRAWQPGQGWIALPSPTARNSMGLELRIVQRTEHGDKAYRRVVPLQ